jgi:cysteinyl-tRNA synthetase
MPIQVYNTLTRRKELFETVAPGKVGMYVCGPTVYKPSHLGHAVGPIIFDTIKRYLQYRGYQVRWVVNITDVDDKLIVEAGVQKCGVFDLAERVTADYLANMKKLNVTGIDEMPRASACIKEIIEITQRLIERGAAYPVDGDVYFDISKDEDYGKLSNRKPEEQAAGTREGLISGGKRNPGDFALWKASKPDEPDEVKFDSPWGKGRPGWHIECSAMSSKYLGQPFDIHGGGMDLIFPHHENEIAQSETAGGCLFARYWMHNGLTRVNTKKVSKSDAQMQDVLRRLTLNSLLEEYSPELVRFFVLQTHYRRPIDFSEEAMEASRKALHSFYRFFERVERITGRSPYDAEPTGEGASEPARPGAAAAPSAGPAPGAVQEFLKSAAEYRQRFENAMDDDFNTAGAIAALFELVTFANRFADEQQLEADKSKADAARALQGVAGMVLFLARLLGLFFQKPPKAEESLGGELTAKLVELLIDVRNRARKARQFEIGDHVRSELARLGVKLEDRPDGTIWRME